MTDVVDLIDLTNHVTTSWISPLTLAQSDGAGGGGGGTTLLEQINNGGITGYIILALSIVAVSLIVIHLVSIRLSRLMPEDVRAPLEEAIALHDLEGALAICATTENRNVFTRIVERGIARYQRSAFGPFEFKDAIEEAGAEEVARLYRATDALGLIGAIAPMLGLLGTVIGMVGAFDTIAAADSRPELLAGDISQALVTTLMGLCLAIPCMAAFTYFRNRIDANAATVANRIEEMMLPLEPAFGDAPPRPGGAPRPTAAAAPTPIPPNSSNPGMGGPARRSGQPPQPAAAGPNAGGPSGAPAVRAGVEEGS